jgi:hypothetical protein
MPRAAVRGVVCAFLALFPPAATSADDPPDSELNPVTGYTESGDLANGSGQRVRHTEDRGHDGRIVTLVSSAAGKNPRLAVKAGGDSWVVWWEDDGTDGVYVTIREVGDGSWSGETLVSDPEVDSRNPEIVHLGTTTWVAYESPSGSSTSVIATIITDESEPLGQQVVATTSYGGDVDVAINAEAGHVWVTWVDSASNIGWSEYEAATETWESTQLESYVGVGTAAARILIRATVLGL